MRIVLNAVAARMGGATTHLPNFLQTAGVRYPDDLFVACVNRSWQPPALPGNVRLVRTDDLRGRLAHAAWDQWGVSRIAVRERADVLVSLLNFGPVRSPIPHVVFERNPVYFCAYYLRGLRGARALEVAATRALAHAVMRGARRVVTPSGAMRDMIRAFYPDLPSDQFRVVPHGFGVEAFRTQTALPERASAAVAGSTGLKLLYVSHAASYKGVEILLDATRRLRDAGVDLKKLSHFNGVYIRALAVDEFVEATRPWVDPVPGQWAPGGWRDPDGGAPAVQPPDRTCVV